MKVLVIGSLGRLAVTCVAVIICFALLRSFGWCRYGTSALPHSGGWVAGCIGCAVCISVLLLCP
jgi:hypothetical protein